MCKGTFLKSWNYFDGVSGTAAYPASFVQLRSSVVSEVNILMGDIQGVD